MNPPADNDQALRTQAQRLTHFYELFKVRHTFKPGDLVTWKPGLRNKMLPDDGQPGIVIDALAEPVSDGSSDGDLPYFHEALDLAVGVTDRENDVLVYWFDSRRMQPYLPQ